MDSESESIRARDLDSGFWILDSGFWILDSDQNPSVHEVWFLDYSLFLILDSGY